MASEHKSEIVEAKSKRVLEGEVVSDSMQKTIVVKVQRTFKHPRIGKTVRRLKKYKVHDEEGVAKCGDWVAFFECRPLSKTKHMTLKNVIRKSC